MPLFPYPLKLSHEESHQDSNNRFQTELVPSSLYFAYSGLSPVWFMAMMRAPNSNAIAVVVLLVCLGSSVVQASLAFQTIIANCGEITTPGVYLMADDITDKDVGSTVCFSLGGMRKQKLTQHQLKKTPTE